MLRYTLFFETTRLKLTAIFFKTKCRCNLALKIVESSSLTCISRQQIIVVNEKIRNSFIGFNLKISILVLYVSVKINILYLNNCNYFILPF